MGNHAVFASGTISLHTAAHEAAHVVQQRAGVCLKHGVGAKGDRYERHADEVADRVVRGVSAEVLLDQMSSPDTPPAAEARAPMQAKLAVQVSDNTDALRAQMSAQGHPEDTLDDKLKKATLESAYAAAIGYAASSGPGKVIHDYLLRADETITVSIGAEESDANQDDLKINWNPYENILVIDRNRLEMRDPGDAQAVGLMSSAVELIHEMGHIKQSLELRRAKIAAYDGTPRIFVSLDPLIEHVNNNVKGFFTRDQQASIIQTPIDTIENDNVKRHEQPISTHLGEVERPAYSNSLSHRDVTRVHHASVRDTLDTLNLLDASATQERVRHNATFFASPHSREITTAIEYIQNIRGHVATANVTGHKARSRPPLLDYLDGIVQKLEEQQAELSETGPSTSSASSSSASSSSASSSSCSR